MRVSNSQIFFQSLKAISDLQASTEKYSQQISSGKRVLKPADDALAAANIRAVNERISSLSQYTRNADLVELRLSQQETVIHDVENALQRIRELVVQGKSTVLNDAQRRFIAAEIRERGEELFSLANTRNSSGEFIFAGTAVDTQPFTKDLSGAVVYDGDQVVRRMQISELRTIEEGFSGHEVFMAVRNGNGTVVTEIPAANTGTGRIVPGSVVDPSVYQAHDFRISFTGPNTFDVIDDTLGVTVLAAQPYVDGASITFNGVANLITGVPVTGDEFLIQPSENQSIFQTVNNLVQALETPLIDAEAEARFQFNTDRAFEDIDQSIDKMLEVRASIGARHNTLDSQRFSNEEFSDHLDIARSKLEDVDIVRAISMLARESNALEAAQAAFVRVQGLSLFDFM
jgi:flagellar hook-associated protein 3 FlgL